MSRLERGYSRGWEWSVFHRCMPKPAYMIDIDYLECCSYCKKPLLIGEVAKYIGQSFKATTILRNTAIKLNIPGYLIFINTVPIEDIVKDMLGKDEIDTIPQLSKSQLDSLWNYFKNFKKPILRVKRIYPNSSAEKIITAFQFHQELTFYHEQHEANCPIYKNNTKPLFTGGKTK